MASIMIGRAACPECGFESAHVKQSERCIYRWCPECGAQHYARNERQRADLMAKTRQVPGATGSGSTSAPAAEPAGGSPTGSGSGTESGTATDTTSAAGGTGSGSPAPAHAGQPAKRSALFGW